MRERDLREQVRTLLLKNVKHGFSGLLGQDYCYVSPSLGTYPFQWFWDTCFHVIMLARLGEHELAWRNLRSLFSMQPESGFVGHMIFWKQVLPKRRTDVVQARPSWQSIRPHMSALIQPPLAGTALLCLFDYTGDRALLGELYAKVRRQHEWLAQNRDFDGDGLLTIISPFESGMDWKPSYDEVLGYRKRVTRERLWQSALYWKGVGVDWSNFVRRYDLVRIKREHRFLVKDAGFNAIYAMDLQSMEKLAKVIGDDPSVFAARRARVVKSMVELMYDQEDAAFYDVREPGSRKLRVLTPTTFYPLLIDDLDADIARRMIERHLDNEDEFAAPFPVPSVARKDIAFRAGESDFIWRGPTWAVNNWFLYYGLRHRRFTQRAERLRDSLQRLVEKSGFREYYDPFTGEGYGAREFTWSGLVVDMVG
jgi:glycogen debranching enzyme